MSIRLRIFIAYSLIVVVGLLYLTKGLLEDVRPRYLESVEETLVDVSTLLSAIVAEGMERERDPFQDLRKACEEACARRLQATIYDHVKKEMDLRVYITDDKGIVLFDSEDGQAEGEDYSQWNDVVLVLRGEYGVRTTRTDPEDVRTEVLYVASPVFQGNEIAGVLTVCKPTASVNAFIEQSHRRITVASLLVGVGVVAMGVVTGILLTRPIEKLTGYAREVRDGARPTLPALGRNEIGELGQAFEEMREALEGKKYIEEYVQSLTHAVKGPLSAIRGASELLQEEMPADKRSAFVRNIRNEVGRIQDIVDRLLQLSALESRRTLSEVESVDLEEIVAQVVTDLRPAALSRRVHIENRVTELPAVRGEAFLLDHAVANLVQNAIEFSPQEGTVTLSSVIQEGTLDLVVEDEGAGIPEYALDKVFDRFYSLPRPGSTEKSSGLGLSFVKEVADLHGGRIALSNRPEGGARAVLTLPRYRASLR